MIIKAIAAAAAAELILLEVVVEDAVTETKSNRERAAATREADVDSD